MRFLEKRNTTLNTSYSQMNGKKGEPMETVSEPEFLTINELAAQLKLPKKWIYERTRKGPTGIPQHRFGKHIRFKKNEVLEFFKNEEKRF